MLIKNGMILAAGLGTRMRHLTTDRPKPLIPVKGKPMIDHVINKLQGEGAENIVVNTHYKAEMLEVHLANKPGVHTLRESELLGQGGGIKNALSLLGNNPFFTVNSDALWTGDTLATLSQHWQDNMNALLLVIPTPKHKKGDFHLSNGKLSWRQEGNTAPYQYTGIQLLHPRIIQSINKKIFSLQEVYHQLSDKNELYGAAHTGDWFHMGTVEELEEVS